MKGREMEREKNKLNFAFQLSLLGPTVAFFKGMEAAKANWLLCFTCSVAEVQAPLPALFSKIKRCRNPSQQRSS